jgi:hypothetical protein
MTTYEIIDQDTGEYIRIRSRSVAAAQKRAAQWLREGWSPHVEQETLYVSALVLPVRDRDAGTVVDVALHPSAPPCEPGHEHSWYSPHEILGGLRENPGVWGHGGGVIIHEICRHCGMRMTTDTWAQHPQTGEQGLTRVTYEPGWLAREMSEDENEA